MIDGGELFTFAKVELESVSSGVDPKALCGELLTSPGATYDQSAMDRAAERLTVAVSEQGIPFARARPRAMREPETRISPGSVQSEMRTYYPISDKITLVGRAVAGHIEGWDGDEVRLLDLFYKGCETIRGFEQSAQCGSGGSSDLGVCLVDDATIRVSVGASIMWNSPLEPLRLDIAKTFRKESYDEEQLICFGASTRF